MAEKEIKGLKKLTKANSTPARMSKSSKLIQDTSKIRKYKVNGEKIK